MNVSMTAKEQAQIAAVLEEALNRLDPATTPMKDGTPLRRIADAAEGLDAAQHELGHAVAAAREAGHTWADIGIMLGVSRQAAFQRFGRSAAA